MSEKSGRDLTTIWSGECACGCGMPVEILKRDNWPEAIDISVSGGDVQVTLSRDVLMKALSHD